jgi:D-tyrosyl-tRNA(Tyr) deacylase
VKAVVQRCTRAEVRIDGRVAGQVGRGLVILLGVSRGDTDEEARALAAKVAKLRIFPSERRPIDRSVLDVGGGALVVSQFTLCADTSKGNRPSFSTAAAPEEADRLYEFFCTCLGELGVPVATGEFGAMMDVELVNDGPVTIVL